MDRITVYSGEVPRTVDFLQAEQNTMGAQAKIAADLLGTTGFVSGLACTQNSPAALNVLLTGGQVYQLSSLEATTWSALSVDTSDQIVKQGIQLATQTISITPPGTGGFSQVFLIEVQYADSDSGSTVLPYFNASVPTSPFSGPANSGTPQNTTRKGTVSVQVKAGTAATTGTQVAPSVDAGWIGLWLVTVANGASTITSGNIVQVANAPFLGSAYMPKIGNMASYIQSGSWGICTDTGTANALAVAPSPAPASLALGTKLTVKVSNSLTSSSTLTVALASGSNTSPIVRGDGTATQNSDLLTNQVVELNYDGANWQLPRAPLSVTASTLGASALSPSAIPNLRLNASVASNALTITVVGANNATPSASNPIPVIFRDSTLANGDPVEVSITGALSVTIPSTATLGVANNVISGVTQTPFRGWVVLYNSGGTPVLGVINCLSLTASSVAITSLMEETLQSPTTTPANSAGVFYSQSAVSANSPFRILGYFEYASGLATVGAYVTAPTKVHLYNGGKKPGDVVQSAHALTGTTSTTTQTSLTGSITPSSSANIVRAEAEWNYISNGVGGPEMRLSRGTGPTYFGTIWNFYSSFSGSEPGSGYNKGYDFPATTSSVSYYLFNLSWNGGSAGTFNNYGNSGITLQEIMA